MNLTYPREYVIYRGGLGGDGGSQRWSHLPKGTELWFETSESLGPHATPNLLWPTGLGPPSPLQGLGPAKEIGLLDIRGGVAVATVAELVVVASLPQHHLVLGDGVLAAHAAEADGAAATTCSLLLLWGREQGPWESCPSLPPLPISSPPFTLFSVQVVSHEELSLSPYPGKLGTTVKKRHLCILPLRVFKRRWLTPGGPWLRSLNNVWKARGCTALRSVAVEVSSGEGRAKRCQQSLEWVIFLNRFMALKAVKSKPSCSRRQVSLDPSGPLKCLGKVIPVLSVPCSCLPQGLGTCWPLCQDALPLVTLCT